MKHISVPAANNLYICLGWSTIHKHKVYDEIFHEFCTTITKLESDLGEQAGDDYWQELLREVKYYRFLQNAAPLPLNTQCEKLLPSMQKKLKNCHLYFPNFVLHVQNLVDNLSILLNLHDNPLLEAILNLVPDQEHQTTALLLKETYLIPLVEDVLASHPTLNDTKLVNQYQLRDADCYQQLLVIGPSYWYPEYILRSPRAKEVHLIRYGWLADRWSTSPIFVKPFIQQRLMNPDIETTKSSYGRDDDSSDEPFDFEHTDQDILPKINWKHISNKILRQTEDDPNQEHVLAKLYILANERAVFLDADENTKVLVLDLEVDADDDDEDELHQINRIALSKVLPGMFILLRTEGGGDYIVLIADGILREKAPVLRAKQEQWKTLLRKAVDARGIFTVSVELLDLGSDLANETNVRNWMSRRSIRPHNEKDFKAIMRLVGLQDGEQEYRDAAEQIESAHRKAGFYIRKQLLKRIANADLRELHRKGYMDFELAEADGGSLTAFRIEHIAPEVINMPASRIGHPTIVKDLLWH